METIVINGRFLSQRTTGVQRYARELTAALIDLYPRIEIFVPENADPSGFDHYVRVVGSRVGHLWEQIDLPRALTKRGASLLLNFANLAPLAYRNQVLTLHDVAFLRHPESFSLKFRTFYRIIVPLLLRRVIFLTTVSEFSKSEIRFFYSRLMPRTIVIPNAVNGDFRIGNSLAPPTRPFILAVSSVTRQKNFARLLSAFQALPESVECDLYVAGAKNPVFADAASSSGFGDRIKMLGYVRDDELIELYQTALAFVFPSLYEGFGIPPLEAQACGCPVIASDVPGIRETLLDSAFYFKPTDPADMNVALNRVIEDSRLRDTLRSRGFVNAQRFSWKNSAKRLLNEVARINSSPRTE